FLLRLGCGARFGLRAGSGFRTGHGGDLRDPQPRDRLTLHLGGSQGFHGIVMATDIVIESSSRHTAMRRVIMGILLRPGTLFAAVFLIILLFLAVFGPSIVHYSPTTSNVANALQPPGAEHWAGTDQLGRDVLTRVIVATR